MIILLSPAKTLDFESNSITEVCTQPDFLKFSKYLVNGLSKLTAEGIGELMSISPKLAELNHQRFQDWATRHDRESSKQAVLAFKGDVYEGLKAWDFEAEDFEFAQKHLRILSGLYGLLRPLDLIQPHRLEMSTVYANPAGKDLYAFWGDRVSNGLNKDLKDSGSDLLVNLASQEYFKSVQEEKLQGKILTPVFKDEKNGHFKIVSFYAKKARGLMSAFLIRNRIDYVEGLFDFSEAGYRFSTKDSTELAPVFLRSEKSRAAA
jgi:cytoplasmic iron level regulating protein YaaA (DUF328/UPF0246 family)